jgi:hypothetical protein
MGVVEVPVMRALAVQSVAVARVVVRFYPSASYLV